MGNRATPTPQGPRDQTLESLNFCRNTTLSDYYCYNRYNATTVKCASSCMLFCVRT